MGIFQRARDLNALLQVRLGPGAVVLPKDIKRIHLQFATKSHDGHLGPRKFLRSYLPQLKYHNPAVSMTVERNLNQAGPATMTIFYSPEPDPSGRRADSPQSTNSLAKERLATVDMKYRDASEILTEFLKITGGEGVRPSEEDEVQIQESEQQILAAEQDRVRSRLDLEAKRRERRLLQQARHAVGEIRV